MNLKSNQSGFTLLELLVALSVFAVMSVMIFGGLNEVLQVRNATDDYSKRLTDLQLTFMRFSRDSRQLINRSIRDEFGGTSAALVSNDIGKYKVELTRTGYPNPAKINRSSTIRVAYGVEDNKLYRYKWRVLDRASDSEPTKTLLLENVEHFYIRFLPDNSTTPAGQINDWVNIWPPVTEEQNKNALPKLVEVTLELNDWGRFSRLYEFPET